MFPKFVLPLAAVALTSCLGLWPEEAQAQSGTITMSGTVSGRIYDRSYNPMRYVTRGTFKITVVATRYTYRNGSLQIHDGQIWVNGPVSKVYYGASGAFSSRGGTVSSRQTSYRNGMVNQVTISTSNLAPTLNITGWNVAMDRYVAPR